MNTKKQVNTLKALAVKLKSCGLYKKERKESLIEESINDPLLS
jgi:hypothetical protein